MRVFNTAGPVVCNDHYCLPPLQRFNLEKILELIKQKKYFVLRAPRQTGKTTCLYALMHYLNETGQYKALYINCENAQAARNNVELGLSAIISTIGRSSRIYLKNEKLEDEIDNICSRKRIISAIEEILTYWT